MFIPNVAIYTPTLKTITKYKNQNPTLTIFAEVVFTKYALANCVQIGSEFSKHVLSLAVMNGIDYIRLIGAHIKKQIFQQRNEPGKPDDNILHYVNAKTRYLVLNVVITIASSQTNCNSYYERMRQNDNNW